MKRWIPFMKPDPVVAVIRLHGTIATGPRGQLNDIVMASPIERAFRRGRPAAVALSINSPGGSPVQSSLIAARIRRLADEKKVPVYAFVEDAAASGGYWLACAGDEIYADRSSIVGSIGVIMASFGAHEFIARHGIERRVYTSGESKSQLDPFKPEDPKDVERIKAIGGDIHEAFIEHVKQARGDKLADDAALFSGEFWVGQKAVDLGLADGLGHLVPFMKDKFGKDVKFQVFGPKKSLFKRFGAQMAGEALAAVEDRVLWSRFGL
ncbi:MAG: S49 family peptidase [Maritimibacter harenae]|jgi:serine protease SohB|uniref:S49 family peptidase n=1 Tax=Maritimibacter harenae TaxID=2606218 RepID=A0A845M3A3_9RHOB|nr:S49 family peptidase [Maritimibacter harenae]MZR13489.1 S49 family peptidase [Maritimibacter harenae]